MAVVPVKVKRMVTQSLRLRVGWRPLVSLLAGLLLVACAGDSGCCRAGRVSAVVVTPPEAVLVVGESVSPAVAVSVSGDADRSVVWSSSDASVATVANVDVVAVGVGLAAIAAISAVSPSVRGESVVSVIPPPEVGEVVGPGGTVASCDGDVRVVDSLAAADRLTLSVCGVEVVVMPGMGGER